MQTTEGVMQCPDHANVVELAALLEDKDLNRAERRILQQALRQSLATSSWLDQGLRHDFKESLKNNLN